MEDQTRVLQKYYTGRRTRHSSSHGKLRKFFDHFYYVPWILLVAVILFYPVIYCGGKFWYLPLVSMSVALIWIFSLLSLAAHRRSIDSLYWHRGLLLFLAPLLWGCFQLLPLGSLLAWISPVAAEWWAEAASLDLSGRNCLSLAPQSTMQQLHLLAICAAVFYILMNLARSRYNIRLLMLILASSAFLTTAVSLFLYFVQDASEIGALEKTFSGSFLNRNHFACFLGMGIFADIGLILSLVCERGPDNPYDFSWKKLIYPLFFALFIELMALLLTLSRGGTLTVGAGVIFMAFCWICFGRAQKDSRQKILAIGCILVSALIAAMPFVMEMLSERFSEVSGADTMITDDRWLLWKNSLLVLRDFFWTGCGLGSFGDVIQAYEAGNITAGYIVYAHNDWLQWLVEMGGPLTLLFWGLVSWTFGPTLVRLWKQKKTMYRWCGLAAFTALVVASLHELVDFNLQSYPNALGFSVLLAVFFICGRKERTYEELARDGHRHGRSSLLFLLIAAVLCTLVLPCQYRAFRAGIYHTELYDQMHDEKNIWRESPVFGKKLIALSQKALTYAPDNAAVLRRSSDVYLMQIARNPGKDREYWEKSWNYIQEACRRRPFHGEDAYMLSILYSQGRKWLPDYSLARQADLYEWVMKCQPTVLDTAYDMAVSYYYLYLDAQKILGISKNVLEHYRDRSLQLFALSFQDQFSGRRKLVFDMIWYLMPDVPALIRLLPPVYELHEELLKFLIRRNYEKEAELVLAHMEKSLLAKQDNDSYAEACYQLQIYRRNLALMQKKIVFSREERTAFKEAAQNWEMFRWKSLLKQNFIRQEDFVNELWKLVQTSLFSDEIIVEGARILQQQGSISDMVALLVHLTYRETAPEMGILVRAEKLIREKYSFSRPGIAARHSFLQHAIPILMQEREPGCLPLEQLYRHIVMLGDLQADMEMHPEKSWSQMHLIPFYIGRGYELLKVPSRALETYQKALKLSGSNLWIQNRIDSLHLLEERDTSERRNHDAGLMDNAVLFDRFMALLDKEIAPEQIIGARQKADLKFRFLCTAPVPREIQWKAVFRINDRPFYTSMLSFGSAHALTWKAGEIVTGSLSFSPMLEALKKSVAAPRRKVLATVELMPVLYGSDKPFAGEDGKLVLSAFILNFR